MAGHRSPHGRARRSAVGASPRHHAAARPAPNGPTWRASIIATATAVGAVATGAFTALLPTPGDGTATTAGAAEAPVDTTLAAESSQLPAAAPAEPAAAFLAPVASIVEADGEVTDEQLAMLDKAAVLAEELAELHAQQQREQEEADRLQALIEEGGVDGWIAEALAIMDLPQSLAPGIKNIIMAESNGDPEAINNWDSNARAGNPSQGLMQTIPSTFDHYVHPDLADESITHPIANITAGVRYMIDTYGMDTLEAGGRTSSDGSYVGY